MVGPTRCGLFVSLLIYCAPSYASDEVSLPQNLASPNGKLQLKFQLDDKGRASFDIFHHDTLVVSGSLALDFTEGERLGEQMRVIGVHRADHDETYTIPVGKTSSARDHHHELIVSLEEVSTPNRRLDVWIRAFDDGIAFRYALPKQPALDKFAISAERTRLTFAENPQAKLLPLGNFTTSYEDYYQSTTIDEADLREKPLIGLPLLLKHRQGSWVGVTEAGLTDYAGGYLERVEGTRDTFQIALSPLPLESTPEGTQPGAAKVVGQTPFNSPWRVLMIADDVGRLVESNIIFHLNEPSRIDDPGWIKPGKTTFPWWNHYALEDVDFEPGVNTATMKHYIDFCAEEGIPYHSLDGLDIAWYGGPISPQGATDVTTAADSINMPELLDYAKEKGVRLRVWTHWKALHPQLDQAFATYEAWGVEGVMVDFMNRDDQEMVRWYHHVAQKAAEHHLTVTWHGAYKPTGMERTWPNVLSYEAVLNQEYNKWGGNSRGTPPAHNLDVAFVRMLAGPLDYHQGGMRNALPENYRFRDHAPPVQGTRGHQLAMYIVYQNHLPMMADDPASYRGETELSFLVDIPSNWDETRVLHAEFGKSLVIARRQGKDWYLGGMTADERVTLDVPMHFLGNGSFDITLFQDAPAHGPRAVRRRVLRATSSDTIRIEMSRSGGFAAKASPRQP